MGRLPLFESLSPWQATNRLLAGAIAALLIYAAVSTRSRGDKLPAIDRGAAGGTASAETKEAPAFLLQDLTRRNLFQTLVSAPPPPKPPVAAAPSAPPPPPKIPLSQRASSLHLMGIVTGDALQAVVEDRAHQSTRYVVAGDSIDGILVEKVLSDRIVLSFEGETMELTL